ncbi:MAG: tRNA (N(6)-L-threonylcarbamoyladenosine(37)-C(2))-methylthiotransferase MtaB [Lachnospiraceae bacterium]|nr:tRNA (N(6)-L-threonylcarbamoyladenosine(37)-C(2))-methylthiotransferase MtaB [Lachnospiraceae bacterium]
MKVAIHSLGCKVNTFEAQQMTDSFLKKGYEIVPFTDISDIYIINTCSVTNIADHKSRQMLHRARTLNPDAVVVAAGCYANTRDREDILNEDVDIVVLNEEKKDIINIIEKYCEERENAPIAPENAEAPDGLSPVSEFGKTRLFLKVQDGCNAFCSYCIIPYARGRITSPPVKDIIALAKGYADRGYREFVLTGIHLSSYGLDRPDSGEDLISLIESLSGLDGISRIRLGSLELKIVTNDFVSRLSGIPEICPHFHLSLQSGSDSVLKRMNRHYTTEEYFESISLLRETFDRPAITTDVIVGFPGETDEEFEETRIFLERVNFYETHIFKYSRRHGTVADRMPGQLTNARKAEREKLLLQMTAERKRQFEEAFINAGPVEVLIEENSQGYTREYIRVQCEAPGSAEGDILTGKITGRLNNGIMKFIPELPTE